MRINELIVSVLICISTLTLFAQDESDRYHKYGSPIRRQFEGYIGPLTAMSGIERNFSIDLGATGGLILKKKFFAGFYGQKLVTKPQRKDLATIGYPTFTGGEIKMIHGGALFGYIHKPENVIHWGISNSVGLGMLYLYATDPLTLNSERIYNDRIFIIIPRLFMEMNMTKWFKVNVSAGYRFVGKVNGIYVNQAQEIIPTFYRSDYTNPEFSISLLFGELGIRSGMLKHE